MEDEDYDPDIKDDILRPASTRSKIVVNLIEPKKDGQKREFTKDDPIEYELDPYDKVRMKLIFEEQKLYKRYQETIRQIEEKLDYQPKKKQFPFYWKCPVVLVEAVILLLLVYIFFLIIQLALFNLVIIGIIIVVFKNIYYILEGFRYKLSFWYKTKHFKKFIEK